MGPGRQVSLVLSGGKDPESNHYSQFLQTRALTDFVSARPETEVTTLFGSGLTPESPATLSPDVSKKDSASGDLYFIRGEIKGNRPATKSNVADYFQKTLRARLWQPLDRFLLFVTDHGGPNSFDPTDIVLTPSNKIDKAYDNNCIVLWSPGLDVYPENICLSVNELKQWISPPNIPATVPVQFVMSQCYSGAFHYLGYSKDAQGFPHRDRNACGFTAITADASAAGCISFVEESVFDGYERRITEAITGISVATGQPIGKSARRLSEAHDQAIVLDKTKDVPLRTSEAFLLDYDRAALKGKEIPPEKVALLLAKLSPVLQTDMKRRSSLIKKLGETLVQWHPEYEDQIRKGDAHSLVPLRKKAQSQMETAKINVDSIKEKIKEKRRPIIVAMLLDLKGKTDAASRELLEFDMLANLDDDKLVFARLQAQDPSLKKFARYLAFNKHYTSNLISWGKTHGPFQKIVLDELETLIASRDAADQDHTRWETLEGELQRLETQMALPQIVAGMIERNDEDALKDLAAFVGCEADAQVNG